MRRAPEILAPAGSDAALEAALAAGADAVYLGLKRLNARRGAANFAPSALPSIVEAVHGRGARVHLALNIDVSQRELGDAARHLAWAQSCGVDAVLVRDPALLALRPCFPGLAFHLSTQAGVSCSAGVQAARDLRCQRVVLARELSLAEIHACACLGLETEVFVQGALCFCVSGRCLLSSWVGGRSGNRGLCASPCRLPWRGPAGAERHLMSMHDLCAVGMLAELASTGVTCLKIEGRLKRPDWVSVAVGLYRHALDETPPRDFSQERAALGNYTGRQLTDGYLRQRRQALTGPASRPGTDLHPGPYVETTAGGTAITVAIEQGADGATRWTLSAGAFSSALRIPRRQAHDHGGRDLALAEVRERLAAALPQDWNLDGCEAPMGLRIQRRDANALVKTLTALLHRLRRRDRDTVEAELPAEARAMLSFVGPHPANRRQLGLPPDRIRIEARRAADLEPILGAVELILEDTDLASLASLERLYHGRLVVALPAVSYEDDIHRLVALITACRTRRIAVEVNSWDGWALAHEHGGILEAGPGLPVLNALAARHLVSLGCASATVSVEADRQKIEDLCQVADVPLSLVVFGRPVLMRTRVELTAADLEDTPIEDRRGTRLTIGREGGVFALRACDPFDWRDLENPAIRVQHLVADLTGSADPAADWRSRRATGTRFNYDRVLQ